ncbi:MsnO8 family LLM class oxidoreductase [Pseudonocardia sp. TRM90224]|uniref:MsnO8 family LLM class oxidoreductase n=1 Tax=Pseudonocardia sp. TRM90224 TaxID=2812678 RepID=UPI001E5AB09F|nr:MsnO8 family LLM class oxidoreductase [Pseudonocardia sp. TRM90224]
MRLSVLDIAPVETGASTATALAATIALAQQADTLGCTRFWVAEHHGTPSIASTSPAVLLAAVGAATQRIRLGAGGVLLPNHAPMVVAEQFQLLDALHPGAIDLGIGRALGGDADLATALRRQPDERFPADFDELLDRLRTSEEVAVWMLGSSSRGARAAGARGLPFAYAHHFQPEGTAEAVRAYRESFEPSDRCAEPYVLICVNTVCADDDAEAKKLADPGQLAFLRAQDGQVGPNPTVAQALAHEWTPDQRAWADRRQALQAIGGPDTVRRRLAEITADADELMVMNTIADARAKIASLVRVRDLLAEPPLSRWSPAGRSLTGRTHQGRRAADSANGRPTSGSRG